MNRLLIIDGRVVAPDRVIDRGWVLVADGRVAATGAGSPPAEAGLGAETLAAAGLTVCPGFIDLHVHGGGGGSPFDGTPESISRMARFHANHGTTGMLVTTGAMPQAMIAQAVRLACEAAAEPECANIVGIHLEGPYLSQRFKGAQPERFIRPASIPELEQLLQVCPGSVRLVSLAPEEPGALAVIEYLQRNGVISALGHTNATYDEAERAVAAGASHATHTFNAMRPLHHREPGVVGAVLLDDRVTAEVIIDGIHIRPEMARILVRMKGRDRICLVTDAIAATGLADGKADLFGAPIDIVGGIARLPDGTLAGSTLTMDRAVGNMVNLVGVTLADAVRMASLNPARVLGLDRQKGSLATGMDADIVLLDDEFNARMTILGGRTVQLPA